MSTIWNFIKSNKLVWVVLGAIAVFGGGFSVGRFFTPPQTIVTEKVREVVVEKVVEKIKTEVKIEVVKVYLKNEAQKIHRVVAEEKRPDGTEIKTTTEDIGVTTVINENTNSNTVEIRYVDRVVEKWQEKIVEKIVEKNVLRQPDWRVAAGLGVSVPNFLGQAEIGIPGMRGTVVNVELDRRIAGPFWLGLHGNTQGVVGLNLGAVF